MLLRYVKLLSEQKKIFEMLIMQHANIKFTCDKVDKTPTFVDVKNEMIQNCFPNKSK